MRTVTFISIFLLALLNSSGIIKSDDGENNYLELVQKKEFMCVVQIYNDSTLLGSGVVIDNHHILTAAHIFDGLTGEPNLSIKLDIYEQRKITLRLRANIGIDGYVVHPQYKLTGDNDIAVCSLSDPAEIPFPHLYTQFNELKAKAIGIGYSAPEKRIDLENSAPESKKTAGSFMITKFNGYVYNKKETILVSVQQDSQTNLTGSTVSDSGSGLFIMDSTGEIMLAGINSGQGGNYTRVSPFINWIMENAK